MRSGSIFLLYLASSVSLPSTRTRGNSQGTQDQQWACALGARFWGGSSRCSGSSVSALSLSLLREMLGDRNSLLMMRFCALGEVHGDSDRCHKFSYPLKHGQLLCFLVISHVSATFLISGRGNWSVCRWFFGANLGGWKVRSLFCHVAGATR